VSICVNPCPTKNGSTEFINKIVPGYKLDSYPLFRYRPNRITHSELYAAWLRLALYKDNELLRFLTSGERDQTDQKRQYPQKGLKEMSKKKRKKKAPTTNRQAKLKRKKLGKQTNTKYKSLQQKVKNGFQQQGIPTEGIDFVEPPDGVKMSAVILKLAEPLLKQFDDNDKRTKSIIALAIFEWNRLMLPKSEREKFQDEMFATLSPPGDDPDMVGSLLHISDLIAERKKKYFPDLKKWIVDYELILSGGDIALNISSALMKDIQK
jgi:hypothetical protein